MTVPADRSGVIREVNAAIVDAAERLHPRRNEPWDFYCECNHADCTAVVRLTLEAYAALRRNQEPVLAVGHVLTRADAAEVEIEIEVEVEAHGHAERPRQPRSGS